MSVTNEWRVLAQGPDGAKIALECKGTVFDELVIGKGKACWFHIEQMDDRRYWMRVGDVDFDITISPAGRSVKISHRTLGILESTQ